MADRRALIGHSRVAIVGSGFSGLGAAIALKRAGIEDFVILEKERDVGGTWRDNTYPGCQCDVPSHLYSFSFRPNPEWSRTYSTQPEIWAYLRACATEAGVLPHVRFEREILTARWDESGDRWELETQAGTWTCDFLIAAHGALAVPAIPAIEGIEGFRGRVVHSAAWDDSLELDGKRVAVVGTGASAIQIVPRIQPRVDRLHVFQRTPPWVLPHTDRPISEPERRLYRRFPPLQKAVRGGIYAARETLVLGMAKNPRLLEPLRRVALAHLKKQVPNRELRRLLTPSYSPGCKRLLLSNDYLPAIASANTELVVDPIERITEHSIVTADGTERDLDLIVFATGFRVTDNPMGERLIGRAGRTLTETWKDDGLRAYLGTTVAGFPNFFMMTGPNTGIGHTSLLVMIESQIRYVVDCLRYAAERSVGVVEVKPHVVDAFNEDLQRKMSGTVWTMGGCASWYLDDRGRNGTLWPDFTWRFRRLTRRFDPESYVLRPARRPSKEPVSA